MYIANTCVGTHIHTHLYILHMHTYVYIAHCIHISNTKTNAK